MKYDLFLLQTGYIAPVTTIYGSYITDASQGKHKYSHAWSTLKTPFHSTLCLRSYQFGTVPTVLCALYKEL